MNDTQFDQLVKMLDNIRCCIIDVESAVQTSGTQPTSTNSAMDAICALNSAECEHSTGNVGDKLACIYVGECPHKQHQ